MNPSICHPGTRQALHYTWVRCLGPWPPSFSLWWRFTTSTTSAYRSIQTPPSPHFFFFISLFLSLYHWYHYQLSDKSTCALCDAPVDASGPQYRIGETLGRRLPPALCGLVDAVRRTPGARHSRPHPLTARSIVETSEAVSEGRTRRGHEAVVGGTELRGRRIPLSSRPGQPHPTLVLYFIPLSTSLL